MSPGKLRSWLLCKKSWQQWILAMDLGPELDLVGLGKGLDEEERATDKGMGSICTKCT